MPSQLIPWFKRHQIVLFFALTLSLSWLIWIPAAAAKLSGESSLFAPEGLVGGLARWAPGAVALLLCALQGKPALSGLLGSVRQWKVSIFWYLFALLFPFVVFWGGRMIDSLLGRSYLVSSPLLSVYGSRAAAMAPVVLLFAFPGALMEELGWRGFGLSRLQGRTNALLGSLVVGLIWGLWHLPLLVYFGDLGWRNFGGAALAVLGYLPVSLIYAWIFNNTRGSILLVTLYHVGQQIANNFLGQLPTATDEILVWLAAGIILLLTGAENLARGIPRMVGPSQGSSGLDRGSDNLEGSSSSLQARTRIQP